MRTIMEQTLDEVNDALKRLTEEKKKELNEYKMYSKAKKRVIRKKQGEIKGIVNSRLMLNGVHKNLKQKENERNTGKIMAANRRL